ncbi:TetR family transcriptional regulator [Streptomyces sp. NRRL F-4707]|uniref:TetR/AcrR family transcriptional regulator n=1 Tax=Streptomyces sp. NRRL F-4707 TaxID=1519496 RepID=UPI0006AFF42A|nr:TetR/AcrR family transcriptional regulator [Streptomyces sp. NRRL F-4707]KOX28660.1 TetR family transcriptional regulator [Streptomyces sp. NRRL F-4707]
MSEMGTGSAAAGRRRPARERLLVTAARRFYADGVTATGIDTIVAEAGVAKTSLYNNFHSKAELVRAYLDARHEEWFATYRTRLEETVGPREAVLAVFDTYADHAEAAQATGFRGCGLLNAAAELPVGDIGRDVVRRHKETVEELIGFHLGQLLPSRPGEAGVLAEHLSFLLEGAMARAGLEGDGSRLARARTLAAALLDEAMAGS